MREPLQSDAGSFITADPFRCRVWDLNDRIEEYVTEDSCRSEIASMERDGQLVPAVGRMLKGDPDFDVEIVCGARRLFIARYLKIPIRVQIRELTDRQAAVAVETENSLRKQTSPYERGMWLAKLLRQGIYPSRDAMARDLGITPTQVTRLLKFSELPALVIGAFPSPHDILESWAVELHKAWNDERRRLITQRSRSLAEALPRPAAQYAYEILIASPMHGARAKSKGTCEVVRGPDGNAVLRLEHQRKEVVLRIPNVLVDPLVEKELMRIVADALVHRAALKDRRSPAQSADEGREAASQPLATFQPATH